VNLRVGLDVVQKRKIFLSNPNPSLYRLSYPYSNKQIFIMGLYILLRVLSRFVSKTGLGHKPSNTHSLLSLRTRVLRIS
jgi:hypothetical protein